MGEIGKNSLLTKQDSGCNADRYTLWGIQKSAGRNIEDPTLTDSDSNEEVKGPAGLGGFMNKEGLTQGGGVLPTTTNPSIMNTIKKYWSKYMPSGIMDIFKDRREGMGDHDEFS